MRQSGPRICESGDLLWNLMSQRERIPDVSSVAEEYRSFADSMTEYALITLDRP